ncbi:MAG: hypothetical protein IIA82_10580 [Thaumarchaeota archaeon]|nr:hypothetical protein [Nitrososphaerota archaeon]
MSTTQWISLLAVFAVLAVGIITPQQIAFADDEDIEIEIEIRDGSAEIEVEIDDDKFEFKLGTTDLEEIIRVIEVRTGIPRDIIEEVMEVEIKGVDEAESIVVNTETPELKIRAETLGDQTEVKVKLKFSSGTTDIDSLTDEIIEEFSLTREQADAALTIEEGDDDVLKEKFEVEVEIEDGISDVEVELRFVLDSTDREDILDAIVANTQLTTEQIQNNLDLEIEEETETFEGSGSSEVTPEGILSELDTSDVEDSVLAELERLQQENQQLRQEIEKLQQKLDDFQQVIMEQIKVILDTLASLRFE